MKPYHASSNTEIYEAGMSASNTLDDVMFVMELHKHNMAIKIMYLYECQYQY